MTIGTSKARAPKVVAATATALEVAATEADETVEVATPATVKGVRCSQFIVKRERQRLITTRHESGFCRDRWSCTATLTGSGA